MLKSEIVLITPGLGTAEEAFYSKTPVIFLPPSNNSQYIQLDEFRKKRLAIASVHFSDFMPKLDLLGIPLKESLNQVLSQIRDFEKFDNYQEYVGTHINKLLDNREQWVFEYLNTVKKIQNTIPANGANTAAQRILRLIK